MEPAPAPLGHLTSTETAPSACPIDHGASVDHDRTRADIVVRRLLRIRERPMGVSMASAHSAFQRSMAISATRCTLTYIVFPLALPALGFATGVGPVLGLLIGILAITCDVFAVRRFFAIDHKWRWQVLAIVLCVVGLLTVLVVQDIANLTG